MLRKLFVDEVSFVKDRQIDVIITFVLGNRLDVELIDDVVGVVGDRQRFGLLLRRISLIAASMASVPLLQKKHWP